jgi:hypothetical protein
VCNNIDVLTVLGLLAMVHITIARSILRTFEMILGVAKVKIGFSMPPYGKLGGRIKTLYSPQA